MDLRDFAVVNPETLDLAAHERRRLEALLKEAEEFALSHDWCDGVEASYYGYDVDGVLGVFLLEIARSDELDQVLWFVVGDLPSAYIVTDHAQDAFAALAIYCDLMEDWVQAVRAGSTLRDVFPVRAEASKENADLLAKRVEFIRSEILN